VARFASISLSTLVSDMAAYDLASEIIAKKLDYKLKHIVVDDRLYAGAVHDLLNVIHKFDDKLEHACRDRISMSCSSSKLGCPRRCMLIRCASNTRWTA
jgi:hypothetical protein